MYCWSRGRKQNCNGKACDDVKGLLRQNNVHGAAVGDVSRNSTWGQYQKRLKQANHCLRVPKLPQQL